MAQTERFMKCSNKSGRFLEKTDQKRDTFTLSSWSNGEYFPWKMNVPVGIIYTLERKHLSCWTRKKREELNDCGKELKNRLALLLTLRLYYHDWQWLCFSPQLFLDCQRKMSNSQSWGKLFFFPNGQIAQSDAKYFVQKPHYSSHCKSVLPFFQSKNIFSLIL